MNQKGNVALYIGLAVVGVVLVLGIGVVVRYLTEKSKTDGQISPNENGNSVLIVIQKLEKETSEEVKNRYVEELFKIDNLSNEEINFIKDKLQSTDDSDTFVTLVSILSEKNILSREESLFLAKKNPNSSNFIKKISDQEIRHANDITRIEELKYLKNTIDLYLESVENSRLCASSKVIYSSARIMPPTGWTLGSNYGRTETNGAGWIPINFNEIPGGSPLLDLPLDPVNDATQHLVYLFSCNPQNKTFELNTWLDNPNYGNKGSEDKVSADGGDDPLIYEMGNAPGLNLIPAGFWDKF